MPKSNVTLEIFLLSAKSWLHFSHYVFSQMAMPRTWTIITIADYRAVFVLLTLLSLLTLLQQNVDLLHHQTPRVGQNIFLHSSHVAFVFNVSSLLRYNVSYLARFSNTAVTRKQSHNVHSSCLFLMLHRSSSWSQTLVSFWERLLVIDMYRAIEPP